jgi:hypothetical protein
MSIQTTKQDLISHTMATVSICCALKFWSKLLPVVAAHVVFRRTISLLSSVNRELIPTLGDSTSQEPSGAINFAKGLLPSSSGCSRLRERVVNMVIRVQIAMIALFLLVVICPPILTETQRILKVGYPLAKYSCLSLAASQNHYSVRNLCLGWPDGGYLSIFPCYGPDQLDLVLQLRQSTNV